MNHSKRTGQQKEHADSEAALAEALNRAVRQLMAQAHGRAFLRWLLGLGLCFEAAAPGPQGLDALSLAHAEGRRYLGMRLLALLQSGDPTHLYTLLQTREDDHDA